jgi:hypothetical protein
MLLNSLSKISVNGFLERVVFALIASSDKLEWPRTGDVA